MDDSPLPPGKPCATCGKPIVEPRHRPFCSARCKQVDLGRWFSGTYRVETNEGPDDPEAGDKGY
jgi:endogenous inhibitor of DNA gyrase (YacG/DUF329 family)